MAVLFAMRMPKLSRLAGGRAPRGGGGLTSTGTTPDASTDNINESEKGENHFLAGNEPPADMLRRIWAQWGMRISESASPQGLSENRYERACLNRYIF